MTRAPKRPQPRRALRSLAPARVIAPSAGAHIRTRLRLSPTDEIVLRALGAHLGHLTNHDLKRAQEGTHTLAERKKLLTVHSSSRWAGSIVRENSALLTLADRNLRRHVDNLHAAITAIAKRLALAPGVGGYALGTERTGKLARIQVLRARRARVQQRLAAGRPSVCRGTRRLMKTRHNLDAAGLTLEQWRQHWTAARTVISANGSHDELGGNLTIRVSPAGVCSILLPAPLRAAHANDRDRYVLEARATFTYRTADWLAQIGAGAISYTITSEPRRAGTRWYLDASWVDATVALEQRRVKRSGVRSNTVMSAPTLVAELALSPYPPTQRPAHAIGIDLNANHLAVWVLDAGGNPIGRPVTIPLLLNGLSASTRDGHLRDAISAVLRLARDANVRTIFIEDLGWEDQKSREHFGRKRVFRNIVSSFPTAQFRQHLVTMAARAGITVCAVDPAYTSKWSAVWAAPTTTRTHQTTGHHAAALGIGRRGLGLRLGRRTSVTKRHQSDAARSAVGPGQVSPFTRTAMHPHGGGPPKSASGKMRIRGRGRERPFVPARCQEMSTL